MAAEFGAANDRFWEFHDALFENQQQLGLALYAAIATEAGLDAARLRAALEAARVLSKPSAPTSTGAYAAASTVHRPFS